MAFLGQQSACMDCEIFYRVTYWNGCVVYHQAWSCEFWAILSGDLWFSGVNFYLFFNQIFSILSNFVFRLEIFSWLDVMAMAFYYLWICLHVFCVYNVKIRPNALSCGISQEIFKIFDTLLWYLVQYFLSCLCVVFHAWNWLSFAVNKLVVGRIILKRMFKSLKYINIVEMFLR